MDDVLPDILPVLVPLRSYWGYSANDKDRVVLNTS